VYNVGQSEDVDMQSAVVLSKLRSRWTDSEDVKKTGADVVFGVRRWLILV
jgi:hypothetical protein